ncbi:MAG TPA: cupin domain-containing protein [Longimicrobium sp.]
MHLFLSYGLGTDPERTCADIGARVRHFPLILPDHVYTFTGRHPEFDDAGTSTLLPYPGGMVLGVAYEVTEPQLEALVANGHGYVLRATRTPVEGREETVYTLQPETPGEPNPPAPRYLAMIRHGLEQHYPAEVVEMYLARALKRAAGVPEIPARVAGPDAFRREYGCDLRRLFPWEPMRARPFGGAWAVLNEGDATTPHAHDEEETFVFVGGEGVMNVDGREMAVRRGDTVYLEPFSVHTVRNTGTEPLEMLCMWWGAILPAPAAPAEAEAAAAD